MQPVAPAGRPVGQDRVRSALAFQANQQLEEALQVLIAPGDFSADVFTLRGDLQLELGRVHEAVGSYSTVIAYDAQNMYALQRLAECYRRLQQWDSAVAAFQRLLVRDRYNDAARIALGGCLLHLNQLEDALACFEACWSEAARDRAAFGKAVTLQLLGRDHDAEALYERLLGVDQVEEAALTNLIALNMERFVLPRVRRFAGRLYEKQPGSAIALQALTVVALEGREYEAAARYFSQLPEPSRTSQTSRPRIVQEGSRGQGSPDPIQYTVSGERVEQLSQPRRNAAPAAGAEV